jgi:hypothetical protein
MLVFLCNGNSVLTYVETAHLIAELFDHGLGQEHWQMLNAQFEVLLPFLYIVVCDMFKGCPGWWEANPGSHFFVWFSFILLITLPLSLWLKFFFI